MWYVPRQIFGQSCWTPRTTIHHIRIYQYHEGAASCTSGVGCVALWICVWVSRGGVSKQTGAGAAFVGCSGDEESRRGPLGVLFLDIYLVPGRNGQTMYLSRS